MDYGSVIGLESSPLPKQTRATKDKRQPKGVRRPSQSTSTAQRSSSSSSSTGSFPPSRVTLFVSTRPDRHTTTTTPKQSNDSVCHPDTQLGLACLPFRLAGWLSRGDEIGCAGDSLETTMASPNPGPCSRWRTVEPMRPSTLPHRDPRSHTRETATTHERRSARTNGSHVFVFVVGFSKEETLTCRRPRGELPRAEICVTNGAFRTCHINPGTWPYLTERVPRGPQSSLSDKKLVYTMAKMLSDHSDRRNKRVRNERTINDRPSQSIFGVVSSNHTHTTTSTDSS